MSILTSSGQVIDLDSDTDVRDLPPESIKMDRRTYGSNPQFFICMRRRGGIREEARP